MDDLKALILKPEKIIQYRSAKEESISNDYKTRLCHPKSCSFPSMHNYDSLDLCPDPHTTLSPLSSQQPSEQKYKN